MSLARIYRTKRARNAVRCEKCGVTIDRGQPFIYYYVGFRSHVKHIRHDACAPRNSERESSKKSAAYAAVEAAEDVLDTLGDEVDLDEVEQIVRDAADGINEVVEEYREAGGSINADYADELEAAANELEYWSPDSGEWEWEPTPCDEHGDDVIGDADEQIAPHDIEQVRSECPACNDGRDEAYAEWRDALINEAREALASVSF